MVVVLIWLPTKDNKFGHAALQTDKYHMSFWPDGDVKSDLGVFDALGGGVNASLVFHQDLDYSLEGKRDPNQHRIANVTDNEVNRVYERLLAYNDIDPASVTLNKAEEIIQQRDRPEISLSKTQYTYLARFIKSKNEHKNFLEALSQGYNGPFYHHPQSCVSFCFNLVEMADPHPEVCWFPINTFIPSGIDYHVDWFETEIVTKYWLPGCQRDNSKCVVS